MSDYKKNPQGRFIIERNRDNKKDVRDNNSLTDFKRTSQEKEDLQTATSEKTTAEGSIADIIIPWERAVMVGDSQVETSIITEETGTKEATSTTIGTTMGTTGTRIRNSRIL